MTFSKIDDLCGHTQFGEHYDVWTIDLAKASVVSDRMEQLLSSEERTRAARFLRPEVADRFRAARGALRILLGSYLNARPEALRLGAEEYGKPFLLTEGKAHAPAFNVSHSGDVAAYCISQLGPVGVDVEWIRDVGSMSSLLERVGTPEEFASFCGMSSDHRQRWFFRLWTRKEAVSKAVGEGMRLPFDRLHVMRKQDVSDSITPAMSRMDVPRRQDLDVTCWTIRDFPFDVRYCGAVATPVDRPAPARLRHLHISSSGELAVETGREPFPSDEFEQES